jgi:hypothetical protein
MFIAVRHYVRPRGTDLPMYISGGDGCRWLGADLVNDNAPRHGIERQLRCQRRLGPTPRCLCKPAQLLLLLLGRRSATAATFWPATTRPASRATGGLATAAAPLLPLPPAPLLLRRVAQGLHRLPSASVGQQHLSYTHVTAVRFGRDGLAGLQGRRPRGCCGGDGAASGAGGRRRRRRRCHWHGAAAACGLGTLGPR